MLRIALMLLFLACTRSARQVQRSMSQFVASVNVSRPVYSEASPDALRSLATLLWAFNPEAAFNPSGPSGISERFSAEQHILHFASCKREAIKHRHRVHHESNDAHAMQQKIESRLRSVPVMKKALGLKARIQPELQASIARFKTEGALALKATPEEELSAMIRAANEAYYESNAPLLTDNEYDVLREYTLQEFPENAAAQEGHTKIEIVKDKVKLPYEMWSMDKIKPDTAALDTWTSKYKGPHVISCKLDGVSGLYSTEGPKPRLYTRGNGKVGQDVSHMIPYLKLPKIKGLAIRGEFIVPKQVFEAKYADKFANPRNLVAGVVNQKKVDAERFGDLAFVAYEVIKPELIPSEQYKFLADHEVEVVRYVSEETVTNDLLSQLLIDWRDEYKYEIDGLICVNDAAYPRPKGNPEHAFAFKMVLSDQLAEAKVLSVIWSPSKDGYLKPRVQIQPVVLGGATIEYATGFNAKFIEDNHIGVGALVQIVRSGDVIPHIISVVQPAEKPLMPSVAFEWNENNVDILLKDKATDATVKVKTIAGFFKAIGVDGLAAGNIRRIIEAGYDTILKIIDMSEADFLEVEGFKEKTAAKLYRGIHKKIDAATLPQLMHATNIFGRGFGVKKLVAILDSHPAILVSEELSSEKEAKVAAVHGMASKSAKQFVEGIPYFSEWMTQAHLQDRLVYETELKPPSDATIHPLCGKRVITTGIGAKEKSRIVAAIKKVGADLDSSVKKDTFAVLVKDLNEDTAKARKASSLGIRVMLVEDFFSEYDL